MKKAKRSDTPIRANRHSRFQMPSPMGVRWAALRPFLHQCQGAAWAGCSLEDGDPSAVWWAGWEARWLEPVAPWYGAGEQRGDSDSSYWQSGDHQATTRQEARFSQEIKPSDKFVVMGDVQGEAGKSVCRPGSGAPWSKVGCGHGGSWSGTIKACYCSQSPDNNEKHYGSSLPLPRELDFILLLSYPSVFPHFSPWSLLYIFAWTIFMPWIMRWAVTARTYMLCSW